MPEIPSQRMSIWVQIKLDGECFANDTEFDLRYKLEDAVIELGIGQHEGAGSGAGWMDFSFSVDNIDVVDSALLTISRLMEQYKVPKDEYRFEVFRQFETVCDNLPDFQVGDCLTFQFEDSDYGAVLVLKHGNLGKQNNPQIGRPPAQNQTQILLGVLDYKKPVPPKFNIFEERKWLIGTHQSRLGKPYLVWVDCYGGIDFHIVGPCPIIDTDPIDCRFHLSWENIPSSIIREKYRNQPELNLYQVPHDELHRFLPSDGLSYPFPDGDFGAALVLATSQNGPNRFETLLGILDYKQHKPPSDETFENRSWLIITQEWRKSQPYLVWALWERDEIEIHKVTHVKVKSNDPLQCNLNLNWHDIPELVLREKNFKNWD